ncbi:MAG TPA: hypothetical protein VKQ32_20970 [Polyangia bacterium]|nr:hypothetical protein [Polyangia bacterium]
MTPETANNLQSVYLVYVCASIGLTIWLARTLFKNGEVFLEDVFADNPRMAGAVNRLLVVGFYLLNLGYAFVTLRADREVTTHAEGIETLAVKLGSLLLVLGALHMGNLYLFHRIRRRSQIRLAPPPVWPQMHHSGAAAVAANAARL